MTRICVVQRPPHLLDLDAGTEAAVGHIAEAAALGADLAVFPETWLGGYPAWVFGLAGWNDATARHWFRRLVEASATADGDHMRALRRAAATHGVSVVIGFNERSRPDSATLYNSAATIGPDGELLGVHRKLLPTHAERLVWTPGDAHGLRAHRTPAGRVGSLICWEHWHPIARHALHHGDEQIHVALWPDLPEAHRLASRSYAFEGRCFVVAAATWLPVADVPEELREAYARGAGAEAGPGAGGERGTEAFFPGGSGVVGPDGEWRTGPVLGPAMVVADLDLAETVSYKHDLDVTGHYDRPDLLRWSVQEARIR
ncbi:carbon-nitrogen hydrolase family protein [Streptomyces zingiberis]|uniref:Carbon-nitrogen hydrolase family protein n=1 Tax=Streptomyces zingiberis TaxID=2053010 RepID=A0ABX1BWF6_9ACTN|nr:carbon-nitrogen hydrolase family protein [Streptomyces zingiberis]NJQ02042.1 carbon-nitrogen hydrolase family protein [Streptomyces zingiberis]